MSRSPAGLHQKQGNARRGRDDISPVRFRAYEKRVLRGKVVRYLELASLKGKKKYRSWSAAEAPSMFLAT